MRKPRTIDEVCGKPEGSFKKFIDKQNEHFRQLEIKRKERMRATREQR